MRLTAKAAFLNGASGAGWVYGNGGERYWGLHGAAGCLLRHRGPFGVRYLLLERAPGTHHGGTWGIPGGALRRDETPLEGALRELWEETGIRLLPSEVNVVGYYKVGPLPGWAYSTFVIDLPHRLSPGLITEHASARWLSFRQACKRRLHPAFAAAFLCREIR